MPPLVFRIFACIINMFLRHFWKKRILYCQLGFEKHVFSYLEHSISWFKESVAFWTELLMYPDHLQEGTKYNDHK